MNEDEFKIESCTFSFLCTKTWPSLTKTDLGSIRYCTECDRGVHLCKTEAEVIEAKNNKWCVAITTSLSSTINRHESDSSTFEFGDNDEGFWLMGDLSPPFDEEDELVPFLDIPEDKD